MADEPSEEDTRLWHRRMGAAANNRGWALSEQPSREIPESAEMLDAAHAARHHWSRIGTPRNLAHANMLLGHVHALLGNGDAAMRYGQAAFAYLESQQWAPWEEAFANAVLANAAHASGLADSHRSHHARALAVAETIATPEERAIFDATFRVVPPPVL